MNEGGSPTIDCSNTVKYGLVEVKTNEAMAR